VLAAFLGSTEGRLREEASQQLGSNSLGRSFSSAIMLERYLVSRFADKNDKRRRNSEGSQQDGRRTRIRRRAEEGRSLLALVYSPPIEAYYSSSASSAAASLLLPPFQLRSSSSSSSIVSTVACRRPANVARCDDGDGVSSSGDDERAMRQRRIRELQSELDKPCPSCLYVGVGTCLGMAGYFAHLAFEEQQPQETTTTTTTTSSVASSQQHQTVRSQPSVMKTTTTKIMMMTKPLKQGYNYNRPFFLAVSACWMVAGAYRWHLG